MADIDNNFAALAIRDTNSHTSGITDTGEFNAQTIAIKNGLDQQVTLQFQGSLDKTTWFDVGDSFAIAATTNDYQTVTDYFPCYRLTAVCTTAPTTGALDAWILKTR